MTKLNTIFIYTPTWLEFGGGEKYILLLAEVLSNQPHVKVTLLLDEPGITESKLKNFSQTDLKNIECINIGSTNELKVIINFILTVVILCKILILNLLMNIKEMLQ